MAVNVGISGLDAVSEMLNASGDLAPRADRMANRILSKLNRQSKIRSPIKTGRLRSTIYSKLLGFTKGSFVSTNVDYAVYVHEGTDRMINRPFMDWAVDDSEEFIDQEVDKFLDELLK